jgi:hypothetical protein
MKEIDGVKVPKKKLGPAEWVPTEDNYQTIERCSSIGMKETTIAGVLGINPSTLNESKAKYSRIANSLANANGRLADNLTMQVMSYINDPNIPYPAKRKDIQFVLSMKCGWRTQVNIVQDAPQLPSGISFIEATQIDPADE